MLLEPRGYPVIEPGTALGKALVEFFSVLEPVYADGDDGSFSGDRFRGLCGAYSLLSPEGVLTWMQRLLLMAVLTDLRLLDY